MTQLGDRIDHAPTNTHDGEHGPLPAPLFFGLADADPALAAFIVTMLAIDTPLYASALGYTPPPIRAARKGVVWATRRARRTPAAPE